MTGGDGMRDAFGDQLRAAQTEHELADVGDALRRFAEENGFNPELGARELLAKAAGSFRSCAAMSDARYDEIRRLRAEIEAMRPRLMPEGMEWPAFEDGEPVRIGDEYECWCGDTKVVSSVTLREGRSVINESQMHSFVVSDGPFAAHGKRVKRPAPKVLDADGVEIREGDAVWIEKTGDAATVMGFSEPGGDPCAVIEVAGCEQRIEGDRLTHERPDSWDQWRREWKIPPCDYCKRFLGIEYDHETQLDDAFDAQGEDLVRRAKKLAGVE